MQSISLFSLGAVLICFVCVCWETEGGGGGWVVEEGFLGDEIGEYCQQSSPIVSY